VNVDVSDVQLKVLKLSHQFIATIGTFEATRFFFVFRSFTVNWLPVSALRVNSWQMLHGSLFPTNVLLLISRTWLNYVYFVVQLEVQF